MDQEGCRSKQRKCRHHTCARGQRELRNNGVGAIQVEIINEDITDWGGESIFYKEAVAERVSDSSERAYVSMETDVNKMAKFRNSDRF